MSKIEEIIIEPSKVYTSETFKIKIKARRYLIYEEIKKIPISQLKQYEVNNLKGE